MSREEIRKMSVVGTVESLCRYPVKSMRGEELENAFVGFSGIYGDRLFAFKSSSSPEGFPYLTAREQKEMLLYRPRFRHPDKAARPTNLADAEKIAPGVTPVYADSTELVVDVETPSGEVLAIDDPALAETLTRSISDAGALTVAWSDRAMTDCRPISLFAVQSAQELGAEVGFTIDKRRFRANVYMDLESAVGFAEDAFVGRRIQIGPKVVISILERDPRCKMITLDPDTGESSPEVLREVAQAHDGMAGIYGAVLVEGTIQKGDVIVALDSGDTPA